MKNRALGFTLIELLVTLALVGISASVVLPLATVIETRARETELRRSLRTIRQALDSYKLAADTGVIDKATGSSGYPATLDTLVKGVPRSAAMGYSPVPMVFLRSVPRDPFAEEKEIAPSQTWNIRSYGSKPGEFGAQRDVFDVSSKSERSAMDGSFYKEW